MTAGALAVTTLISEDSLCRTLDAVEDLFFNSQTLASPDRLRAASWIAARQGLPGAKSGSFAALPGELSDGFVAFTGERFTHASARHILGEEACRALRKLDVDDVEVQAALDRADEGLTQAISRAEYDPRYGHNPGAYCCAKCTVGVWRNLLSGGLDRREERLRRGVGEFLRSCRATGGKWAAFPFWYTVLALAEMESPEAREELLYAAPALERAAQRTRGTTPFAHRRQELARRALELI